MAKATYDFGVEAFKTGMYLDAMAAFREVIHSYPNSAYAPGARVWLDATKRALNRNTVKVASPNKEKPSPLRTIVGVGATILLLAFLF
ncbi:hypothetical protein IIA15_07585 [candidate division TA06 bacterium]|nr:hypothetical protein [candidate division TA06 bacterium]